MDTHAHIGTANHQQKNNGAILVVTDVPAKPSWKGRQYTVSENLINPD